jgi:hypothetical protein
MLDVIALHALLASGRPSPNSTRWKKPEAFEDPPAAKATTSTTATTATKTSSKQQTTSTDKAKFHEVGAIGFMSLAGGGQVTVIVLSLLWLAFGGWAVYLSWTSNTMLDWHPAAKVIFAIFAFMSSISYLLTHLINKLDLVYALRALRVVGVVGQVVRVAAVGGRNRSGSRR